ncbi:hypothetical protein XENTR_v10023550 [Xenopus tropicalis]|nr:hypothetical protein XENTR_v10023550 [Xenopus tropicalis]
MCGSRVRDCSGLTLVTAPPCPQQLVLQLAAAERVASGPVSHEILPQGKNEFSCDTEATQTFQLALKGREDVKEDLEKRAEEEAKEYARHRNTRMILQDKIKERLHKESLQEAEQFSDQQKQRFMENESCRILEREAREAGEEAREEAKRELASLKVRNVLHYRMHREEDREDMKRQTDLRLKEKEKMKTRQEEALDEAQKETMKRTIRNVLLNEQIKIEKQQQEAQKKDVSEEPRVARRIEFPKRRPVQIRKAPLWKPASFIDSPDDYKRRTQYYEIIEKIDEALGPSGLDRRLLETAPPTIEDFQLQSYLGEGTFGKVYKAQHRKSGKVVAIKAMEMHNINKIRAFKRVAVEQRILRLADEEQCPFLVRLRGSFRAPNHVCLAMEFAEGGDLASYTATGGIPLDRVRFYSACMVLGLQFLHRHNIAHRDIKVANVLLCSDGYAQITDFGLCKEGMTFDRTASYLCGTLPYLAPEVIRAKYTRTADWWSLGVTIFKLLTGTVPFYGANQHEVLKRICYEEPKYPEDITEETRSLLVNLLKKDPAQRLGAGEHGAEDVKKSPFFQGLDWEALEKKELEPPFIPGGRTHSQPEESLKLMAKVDAKVWEETEWALVELNYPFSSASEI